ncbi:MAG TPA: DUF2231 domain-containing protein [Candidatus Thermoplasmatota archaeon]|nr:DUF2231 domain-containing protein [Candidatus Thermoplasmatota archaeon]
MALPGMPPVVHPLFVHFAITLIPASAAFALWYAWRRTAWTRPAAYALMTAAALLSLLAMGTGFRDYFAVKPHLEGNAAFDVLETHELLGVVTALTVAITAAIAWWRRADVAVKPAWRWALAVALAAATLLVLVTAWYGGSLVYDHGVAVTDTTPGA